MLKIVLIGKFCTSLRSPNCSHTPKYAPHLSPCDAQNFLNHLRFLVQVVLIGKFCTNCVGRRIAHLRQVDCAFVPSPRTKFPQSLTIFRVVEMIMNIATNKRWSPFGTPSFYPNATSSTIISAKPIAKPMVELLEWLPLCDSGISSSTTT